MYNGSLTRKRIIEDINGNRIVDICAPTVDYRDLVNLSDKFHMVSDEEAMRPDLIADGYYGDVEKIDAILWRNGIFNPFSIDARDIINIPYARDTEVFYKTQPKTEMPGGGEPDAIGAGASALNRSAGSNGLKEGQRGSAVSGANIILGTHLNNE